MLAQADPNIWSIMLIGLVVAFVLGVVPLAVLGWYLHKKQREPESHSSAGRTPNDAAP